MATNNLASLKLTAAKKPTQIPLVQFRRNKLIKQVWEQMEMVKAISEGRTFAPLRVRTVVDKETGERKTIEAFKRVKQWWFVDSNGHTCIQVRYGTRALELAKGKCAIELASPTDLLATLEAVKSAVEAGELDAQIQAASAAVRERFVK